LGWLRPTTNYVQTETNGTFILQNYERRPAVLKALRVRRGTGNNAWLWIEARKRAGIYDSQLDSQVWSGALIHYQDESTGTYTDLADFTTTTSSMSDPALTIGQTWSDPFSDVNLRVDSATADTLTVSVFYGSLPCTHANPTISVSPTSAATNYGTSKSFTVILQNNDSRGCSPSTFALSASLPGTSWGGSFAPGDLQVLPGQQARSVLTVSVPNGFPLGTYLVSIVGANFTIGRYRGSASTNLTVTEPLFSLSVSVVGQGSVNINPPNTNCQTRCTHKYAAGAAIQVVLKATPVQGNFFVGWGGSCNSTESSCTVQMTAARTVTATFDSRRAQ